MKAVFGAFAAAALATTVGELPCFVRTCAVTAHTGHAGAVFLGTMLGTAVVMGIGACFGGYLKGHLPAGTLRYGAPALFLLMAILLLLEGSRPHIH